MINGKKTLPFSEIFGAPVKACMDAQKASALSVYDFLRECCFDTETGEAVTVSFSFMVGRTESKIILPLMTIVPVPNLTIETLDVNFGANVTDYGNAENIDSFHGEFAQSQSPRKDSNPEDSDNYEKTYNEYSSGANLKISMHASKSNVPGGITKLLGILDECASVEKLAEDMTLPPVDELRFEEDTLLVDKGVDIKLNVRLNGVIVDPETLSWKSSDVSVLKVSAGHATMLEEGRAVVTAEDVNGLTATCVFTSSFANELPVPDECRTSGVPIGYYAPGYSSGYSSGSSSGYSPGRSSGSSSGYSPGRSSGYSSGNSTRTQTNGVRHNAKLPVRGRRRVSRGLDQNLADHIPGSEMLRRKK